MIGIEPASLSTAPVGTKGGDQRVWRFVLVSDGTSTLGDNGGVDQAEWSSPSQNRAESSMDIEPPSLSMYIRRGTWTFFFSRYVQYPSVALARNM